MLKIFRQYRRYKEQAAENERIIAALKFENASIRSELTETRKELSSYQEYSASLAESCNRFRKENDNMLTNLNSRCDRYNKLRNCMKDMAAQAKKMTETMDNAYRTI